MLRIIRCGKWQVNGPIVVTSDAFPAACVFPSTTESKRVTHVVKSPSLMDQVLRCEIAWS